MASSCVGTAGAARSWGQEALPGMDQAGPDHREGGGVFGL